MASRAATRIRFLGVAAYEIVCSPNDALPWIIAFVVRVSIGRSPLIETGVSMPMKDGMVSRISL